MNAIYPRPTIGSAIRAVCEVSGLRFDELDCGSKKEKRIASARKVACILLCRGLKLSQPEAARALGLRSHTSVQSALKRIDADSNRLASMAGDMAKAETLVMVPRKKFDI